MKIRAGRWSGDPRLLLLIGGVFFAGFDGLRAAESVAFSDLWLFAAFALWVLLYPLGQHARMPASAVTSLGLLSISFALPLLVGDSMRDFENDATAFAKVLAVLFVLPYLISDVARSERALHALAYAYVLSGLVNSAASILEYLGIGLGGIQDFAITVGGWDYADRFHGLTVHPNHMAQHCAMALFFAGALWVRNRSHWLILSGAVLFGSMLATGSRGGLLAALLSLAVFFVVGWRRVILQRRAFIGVTAAAVGASLLVVWALASDVPEIRLLLSRIFEAGGTARDSDVARVWKYRAALEDFFSSPFFGLGFRFLGGVENVYLQFLQGGGILGLLGFLIYLLLPTVRAVRIANSGSDTVVLAGTLLCVGVFIFSCLTQNMVYSRYSLVPFGVMWAYINLVATRRAANGSLNFP